MTGSGDRVRRSFRLHDAQDGFQNPFGIRQHIVVPEPQDPIVVIAQPPIADKVALIGCVLPAIHLDHQPALAAEEIRDIGPDRLLPHKFKTAKLPRTQLVPE